MDGLSPFLVGGPAFSGTTLLALLCNQPGMVCLDEPDFDLPDQAHRGVPVLQARVPGARLPSAPGRPLDPDETFAFVRACADAVDPIRLGMKTCNARYVDLAQRFAAAGLPIVMIVRDIRDALVRPLPAWCDEEMLNNLYRTVWEVAEIATIAIRYEDLVRDSDAVIARVGAALGYEGVMQTQWDPADVPPEMLKLDRHEDLRMGAIVDTRVGIGDRSGATWSPATWETVTMMGYGE